MKRARHTKVSAEQFKGQVAAWAKRVRVRPTQVRVQHMTRKWGSCSTAGWVSFAHDLLAEPPSFQEYVIVHELLHLKVPNHGKLFKSYLAAHLPNWRKHASKAIVR